MSAFSSLSEFWQTMLPFIMLVEIVLEIGLFMYQLLRSNKPVRSLLSLAVMAVMIPLLFSVSQADPDNIGDAFLLDAPWLIFAAAIFLAAVHFAIALPREYRRKKKTSSRLSPLRKQPISCLWASALPTRTAGSSCATTVCAGSPLPFAVTSCKSKAIWKMP